MNKLRQRKVSAAHIVAVVSYVICLTWVFAALVFNPYSNVADDFLRYGVAAWARVLSVVAVASWPWVVAFLGAFDKSKRFQASVFSICATGLAVLLLPAAMSAPAEGIGWEIIFFVFCIWALYPVTLLLRYLKF